MLAKQEEDGQGGIHGESLGLGLRFRGGDDNVDRLVGFGPYWPKINKNKNENSRKSGLG